MSWPATERYLITSAPGGLALVQDLMNTVPVGKSLLPDLLTELGPAQEWLAGALERWSEETGHPAPQVTLDHRGVAELRALRTDIRQVVTSVDARETAGETKDLSTLPSLRTATLGARLRADGGVRLEARGKGWRGVASLVLIECSYAQGADLWRRLKTCRNARCGVAFYDRSRNNSGAWHDVRICGNPANLRASRARRRQTG